MSALIHLYYRVLVMVWAKAKEMVTDWGGHLRGPLHVSSMWSAMWLILMLWSAMLLILMMMSDPGYLCCRVLVWG